MMVKGLTIALFSIALSGCATIIASEITSSKRSAHDINLSDLIVEQSLCDSHSYCIKAIEMNKLVTGTFNLHADYRIDDNHQVWQFSSINDSLETEKPLTNQLIVLFPGYGQLSETLVIYQKWLQLMTGAEVIVLPSANESKRFKFGFDFTSPIVNEIKRRKPIKVHLIGFSMGALAAQAVGQEIDNARLYLIAPMTNFADSFKAVWDMFYQHKLYARFISAKTLKHATEIVYAKSNTTLQDTDLVTNLQWVNIPTFIYASEDDQVAKASVWQGVENENLKINFFEQLNHFEMLALLNQDLLIDFASDLLERPVARYEIETIGLLCKFNDTACFDQLAEQATGNKANIRIRLSRN
jgi:hypothetical protein